LSLAEDNKPKVFSIPGEKEEEEEEAEEVEEEEEEEEDKKSQFIIK
jgi:hypothetical protein